MAPFKDTDLQTISGLFDAYTTQPDTAISDFVRS